jgi:hypothetical protein
VAGALKKARSKVFAFNKQLADSQRVGEVQKRGDLIIANVYRWGAALGQAGGAAVPRLPHWLPACCSGTARARAP